MADATTHWTAEDLAATGRSETVLPEDRRVACVRFEATEHRPPTSHDERSPEFRAVELDIAQNRYNKALIMASERYPSVDPITLKSLLVQESATEGNPSNSQALIAMELLRAIGERDTPLHARSNPVLGGSQNPNHSDHGGKSWGSATTAGGTSGNGWHGADTTNRHDSAGSFDRNNWTYEKAETAGGWGNVGGENRNGGGEWENGGWHGPRERNEW